MVCRNTNIALISIVGIVLIISILVLIKVLLADVNGFEWGSFTDWLSAIGTFGTFIIAIIVLMKVPDWMVQKHYDIAYNIIENAVYKDLADVRSKSLYAKNLILNLTKNISGAVRTDGANEESKSLIEELYKELEVHIDEYHRLTYGIINQLQSVSRTNYDVSSYANNIKKFIKKTSDDYNNISVNAFMAFAEYGSHFYTDQKAKDAFEKDLFDIRHDALKNNTYIRNEINKVYSENRPIKDFIIRKKK